ncbi:MAG TPA: YceI family protein [Miltoncostaeaceae bacterium]|nr:YceI family protein [Miltoncostaeaceae bacterium]
MSTLAPPVTGTWTTDTVHSTVEFAARHMVVSTFRGRLPAFQAVLRAGDDGLTLTGEGDARTIVTEDENLTAHLQAPDFLDTQRHPTIRFASRSVRVDGEEVTVEGDLTMRGVTRPVEFRGELRGPAEDPYGNVRLGLEMSARVDRGDFGMNWNAPLPGGGLVLGTAVTLSAHLELVRQAL